MYIYDIADDSWTTGTSMPSGRALHGAGVAFGKIYVAGGATTGGYLDSILEYDPSSGIWTTLSATLSQARGYLGVSSADGKIYSIGGMDGSFVYPTVEEYIP
jgi:N-acetylneuraminic acid mutarotase